MVQGFPEDWEFTGKKTAAYRQVGNAFPPPVARAVGQKIISALKKEKKVWGRRIGLPPSDKKHPKNYRIM